MRSPLLRVVPIALASVVALSACGAARPPAAVVDGEEITDTQLQGQMALFTFLSSLNQQPCGQPDSSIGETARSACARFTLANLIEEDLVKHYATAHHITLDPSAVSSAMQQLESNVGGTDKLDEQLKANGVTRQDLVDLARRLLLFSKTQRAIASSGVSDTELRQLYEQQKEQFTQIHAKHILVKTRTQAARISARVTPKNFASLAKRYSTDTTSATNGGDLGTVSASSLDPAFVQAALALKPGQISGPVHTKFGWHVIELVSVRVESFDRVKGQLASSLESQAFGTWIRGRLASATIRVNPKYGRLDAESGQIVPIRSTEAVASASPSGASPVSPAPSP